MCRLPVVLVAVVLLAACSKPALPDKDKPVEPKALARHDDLERAMREPLQRAKDTQAVVDAAASAQQAQIDAATDPAPDH
ncbi:hypothetical protein [Cognatilysobacter lacus]|uniref:Lipoprotein n=1 Tax=Cognatilysobacter lacus TaxID=1643323 RepID=A0A5D8Z0H9_9GAMM|nr:hypothetical protein [Lysobacter lacus]TZF88485.1 hypothetical protein FW784_09800 [Lysobacter lacus]